MGHMRGPTRLRDLAGHAGSPGGGAPLPERVPEGARSCAALAMLVCLCALAIPGGTGVASTEVPPPSALPAATYPATFSEQRFIRMDDGRELGATITYPSRDGSAPAPGRFPVVLNMTPYSRNGVCGGESASNYATRGFVL